MNKNKIDIQRRNLTQAVWATPIITAVTLPAHAQTSLGETTTAEPTAPISSFITPLGTVSAACAVGITCNFERGQIVRNDATFDITVVSVEVDDATLWNVTEPTILPLIVSSGSTFTPTRELFTDVLNQPIDGALTITYDDGSTTYLSILGLV